MPSFPVPVLGFLFVSFRPSLLRSHSCSTGACLLLSLSAFPLLFRFLSIASFPVLTTQPSVLPFPSSCPRLSGACPVLQFRLSASPLSTFSSAWFPMLLFRFPVLGFLFVSFRPSRFSLPQPFHRCFPSFPLSFVRFFSGISACFPVSFVPFSPLLTTQLSALSFPFFPFSPGSGSFGAYFPLPSGLFPCLSSDSGTQPSAIPFCVRCLASQWLPQRLSRLPFGFRPLPLGFCFRFCLLGSVRLASAANFY